MYIVHAHVNFSGRSKPQSLHPPSHLVRLAEIHCYTTCANLHFSTHACYSQYKEGNLVGSNPILYGPKFSSSATLATLVNKQLPSYVYDFSTFVSLFVSIKPEKPYWGSSQIKIFDYMYLLI